MSTSLNGLNKRVERLEAACIPLAKSETVDMWEWSSDADLLPEEQTRLRAFLTVIDQKVRVQDGRLDLQGLSDSELGELEVWWLLKKAVATADEGEATRCRYRLAQDMEALVQAFLSIDEASLPDYDQAATYTDIRGGTRSLHRTYYRADRGRIERQLARGEGLRATDREMISMWCEVFGRKQGR